MTTVAIPQWNTLGLLPPIDPVNPTSAERSPYPVALLDVILRFATSPERCKVLKGFLDYRAALHGMGLVNGFQWLDGSFTEQVETLERRSPRDIDVVTFVYTPDDFAPTDEQIGMLEHDAAKHSFWWTVTLSKSTSCQSRPSSSKAPIGTACGLIGVIRHGRDICRLT